MDKKTTADDNHGMIRCVNTKNGKIKYLPEKIVNHKALMASYDLKVQDLKMENKLQPDETKEPVTPRVIKEAKQKINKPTKQKAGKGKKEEKEVIDGIQTI